MKFAITLLLFVALFSLTWASSPQRSVIVSYQDDTPDSVLDEAKSAVKQAGGLITHEYKLIKAFAAKAPEKALELVQSQGTKYNALVEDDQQVHTNGNAF